MKESIFQLCGTGLLSSHELNCLTEDFCRMMQSECSKLVVTQTSRWLSTL